MRAAGACRGRRVKTRPVQAPLRINLLPWRQLERERRVRVVCGVLAGALAAAVVLVSIASWSLGRSIDGQERRNRLLVRETALLESRIAQAQDVQERHERLLARLAAIRQLHNDRPIAVHVFHELVNTLVTGAHYRRIEKRDLTLALTGVAVSGERVSALMRNLDSSPWFTGARLERIRDDPHNATYSSGASTFEMTVTQVQPTAAVGARAEP